MDPLIWTSADGSPTVKLGEPLGFEVGLLLLAITPGVREISEYALRLTRGRPMISLPSTVLPKIASEVLTTGGAAVSATVSVEAPTDSVISTPSVWSTLRTRFCCTKRLNPAASNSTVYLPTGRSATRYSP